MCLLKLRSFIDSTWEEQAIGRNKGKDYQTVAMMAVAPSNRPVFTYIPAADLVKLRNPSVAVVDVRDEERQYDGHIAGSLHYPSATFEEKIPDLVKDLKGRDTVVFHCALSQVRGPTCARALAAHLNKLQRGGTAEKVPKVVVLERGFNGWSASGWPVCSCKDVPCTQKP